MRNPYKDLEKALGYRFKRREQIDQAVTHPSYRHEIDPKMPDNQRLEFLGDAALGLVTAHHLFTQYPHLEEGDLTKLRSRMTSAEALCKTAQKIGLGAYLLLGKGEKLTGGEIRDSNLADALESVIGAAYLDGGLKAVDKIFCQLFMELMEMTTDAQPTDNPKGALQELSQQLFKVNPIYRITREWGPAHARWFEIDVLVKNELIGQGGGPNKRQAEKNAALQGFEYLTTRVTQRDRPEEPPAST